MDWFDLLWNIDQQRSINDLREDVDRMRLERDLSGWDLRRVKELAEENLELKLRLGLLVRLLVAKGVFTAEEYADLLRSAQKPK